MAETTHRVKLRVPAECGAIVHRGEQLSIGADGCVLADPDLAATLAAHGAVPWTEDAPTDVATMDRSALIDLFVARTREAVAQQDTETIRATLLHDGEEEGTDDDAPAPTRDDVAAMSRTAVCAFLRARDVDVPTNSSLAELRARAVKTLAP